MFKNKQVCGELHSECNPDRGKNTSRGGWHSREGQIKAVRQAHKSQDTGSIRD